MTKEQIKQLQEAVSHAVEKTVNGKITALTNEFRDYVVQDTADKNKIFEWQEKAEPVIVMGENVQGFGKVSLYIVGFVAAIAGAIISITKVFQDK